MVNGQWSIGNEQMATGKEDNSENNFAIRWFSNRLNEVKAEVEVMLDQFRLSEALKTIYSLIWDDFCSWYLEWIKPGFEQPIDADVYNKTVEFFEGLMELLHPFMPFVTEEIYHLLREQSTDLCVKQQQAAGVYQQDMLSQGALLKQVITALREARNKNQVKPKETIELHIQTANKEKYSGIEDILLKQINAAIIAYSNEAIANTIVVAVEQDKFYIATGKVLDSTVLKADLLKDLEHQKGFLISVEKKLSNQKFVANAKPEVLAMEQKKKADAEARIKTIEESLSTIS